MVTIRIDSETGKRAALDTVNSRFEIFREENAPAETRVVQSSDGGEVEIVTDNSSETEEEIVEDIF